jgi:group I intron endonuclease
MIIYSIYKCVNNLNGKVYIGIDKNWPMRRYAHKSQSKLNRGFSLHKAISKYGWDNFTWELIYLTKFHDHVKEMEIKFIAEYDSYNRGYNETLGGEGTLGKKQSPKNKLDQSIRRRNLNQKSSWFNNGRENSFCVECPSGWVKGRLYQKPTTLGNKWYNNGIKQVLTANPPEGWNKGMLPKR